MIRQPSKRSLCNGFQQFLGLFQQPPRDNSKSFHCLTRRQIQDCCNIQGGALCDNSHYYHNDLQLVCCSSPRSTSATGCNFSITCILLGILRSSLECHFVKNTFAQQFCFLLKNLDFRNNRIRGNSDFLWNFRCKLQHRHHHICAHQNGHCTNSYVSNRQIDKQQIPIFQKCTNFFYNRTKSYFEILHHFSYKFDSPQVDGT